MPCSQSEAQYQARILLSGYTNANPPDPEFYLTQVCALFCEYEADTVRAAASPSGVPSVHKEFLPNVGQIKKWCDGEAARRLKTENYAKRVRFDRSPSKRAQKYNLFVPSDVPGYELVYERIKSALENEFRAEQNHLCFDNRVRDGIWIPAKWWEELSVRRNG